MNLLTKLLRREATVLLAERHGRAQLAFRYGGGAATLADLLPRWPELEPLASFVPDPGRLSAPVEPDRLPDLLLALAELGRVPRLEILVAERFAAPSGEGGEAQEEAAREESGEGAEPESDGEEADPGAEAAADPGEVEAVLASLSEGQAPDARPAAVLEAFRALVRSGGPGDLERMLALWRGYIGRMPELAGAPARWIWDWMQARGGDIAPGALLERLPGLPGPVVDAALTAMADSGAPLRLPVWVLSTLSDYDLSASRFYRTFPDQAQLDALFSDAVAAVDAALRREEGQGMLSARCIARLREREVAAFQGVPGLPPASYTLRLRLFHRNPRLQTYLRLLLRCVENGLRARYRYSGRLQGDPPDAASRAAVEAFLAQLPPVGKAARAPEPAPRRQIALNMADVARLRADSDATRAALLAAVARDAWPEAEEDVDEDAPPAAPEPMPQGQDAFPGVPAPWRDLLLRADVEALRALLRGPEALRALAAERKEMPDRLLDGLNEAAADTLGDLIADGEGVYEEYRDALAGFLG